MFVYLQYHASVSVYQVKTQNLKSPSQGWSGDGLIIVISYYISGLIT